MRPVGGAVDDSKDLAPVDYVGLTLLRDETWDAAAGLAPQSFGDLISPKYLMASAYVSPSSSPSWG